MIILFNKLHYIFKNEIIRLIFDLKLLNYKFIMHNFFFKDKNKYYTFL
jgi:hypothetical protein